MTFLGYFALMPGSHSTWNRLWNTLASDADTAYPTMEPSREFSQTKQNSGLKLRNAPTAWSPINSRSLGQRPWTSLRRSWKAWIDTTTAGYSCANLSLCIIISSIELWIKNGLFDPPMKVKSFTVLVTKGRMLRKIRFKVAPLKQLIKY